MRARVTNSAVDVVLALDLGVLVLERHPECETAEQVSAVLASVDGLPDNAGSPEVIDWIVQFLRAYHADPKGDVTWA